MLRGGRFSLRACAAVRGHIVAVVLALSSFAGVLTPVPVKASVTLSGFGVSPSGPGSSTTPGSGTPATPPAADLEPLPSADANSDSVGATPATFRVDESGASTYSVPLYIPPGTAGLAPSISLEYNTRASNGPLGPGWAIGGLSAIAKCKKATEYGDGAGPFPGINFDNVAADQAYCIDGARLLDLNSGAGNCPAGLTNDTAHEFGLELDPATRVCGYTKPSGTTGYAYWYVSPKDGSSRIYGAGNNSALVRNDASTGTADATQYFSWGISRIADPTGNTIEFSYSQANTTGEMEIAEIDYTAKIALTDMFKAAPTFTRSAYAKVVFNYVSLPATSQRIDYVADMQLALTKQLSTISVQGPQNHGASPDTLQTVRTYHLNYGTPTASGLSVLTSLQECAPNGTGEACYPPTQFAWGISQVGYPNSTITQTLSGFQNSIDFKLGDVDGDGRQDIVFVKDETCTSSGSGATRFQIYVALSNAAGFNTPVATGVFVSRPPQSGALPSCGGDFRSYHFESLWYLYDFSGDGRDDLLVANGTAWNGSSWTNMTWKIYPAIARTSGGGYTFDSANPVTTGLNAQPDEDGLFADLSGDGLPDLLHGSSIGGITATLVKHVTSGTLAFQFDTTNYVFFPNLPGGSFSEYIVGFSAQPGHNLLNADLNGDGASDLVFQVTVDDGTCGNNSASLKPGRKITAAKSGATYSYHSSSQPLVTQCKTYWYTFRNQGFTGGATPDFNLTYETQIGQVPIGTNCPAAVGKMPCDGGLILLADINGDGQADLVYPKFDASGNYTYSYRLNRGKANDTDASERYAAEQSIGLTLTQAYAQRLLLLDVNGDHRADLVYWTTSGTTFPLKAQLWTASGFGSAIDIGNSALNAQNPTTTQTFFADVEGKGAPDLVRASGSSIGVYAYAPLFGGNDFLASITNGLGAATYIYYYPLSYTSSYKRAYDGPTLNWGRGSPVFDVFSAIWVVHQAQSSAPTASNPTALSSVVYSYSGAKIQAGGRGFLGFKTVQAENQQPTQDSSKYLVTTTEYRQDFPFIGRPDHTVVQLEATLQPDPCNSSPGDNCFVHDPPSCPTCRPAGPTPAGIGIVGAQVLSDASDQYASTPAFAPSTVQPVMPYLSSSDEQKFDVVTSGTLSHEVTSSFVQDKYGNVSSSSVISSETSGIDETKSVSNVYGCTLTPPKLSTCINTALSTEWQRLGRLSISTVTSTRGSQSTLRRASFEYDATTLQRVADIQGPYDSTDEPDPTILKTLGLRTDFIRDGDGNATKQVQCSTTDFANGTACKDLTGFQQRQWSATPTKIQRYATRDYDAKGRFELDKQVPFYSASIAGGVLGYAEQIGSTSTGGLNRDAFGNPLTSFSATGDKTSYAYGLLGRAYFTEDSSGAFARTTYSWCTDASTPGIPAGAPRVSCPIGGVYRVTIDSVATGSYAGQSAAPTTWSYFDALGREMLRTKRVYQQDVASNRHWASVTTTYDSTGRVSTTSTPYFSIDPGTTQTTNASTRAGTVQTGATAPGIATTTYDAADRAKSQSHPEESANSPSNSTWDYSALTTTGTNPRSYQTKQVKNARDELVSVAAPIGQSNSLTVNYDRDAVGNLTAVRRTPTDGDSAGVEVKNSMQYDRLGRKTKLTDPDKGIWIYTYNALGELLTQQDAKGQTQTIYRDALGRVYQRNETRLSGGNYVSEPTSTWEYDTAARGLVHIESNGLGGFSRTISYDSIGRVTSASTTVDSYTFAESQTYDQFGRPFQHFDPSNPSSTNGELTQYSTDGYPIRTREANNGTTDQIYNEVIELTARGQVREEKFHDNAALDTVRTYDDNTGRVLTINTDNNALQNWSYDYDAHSNVLHRYNLATGYNLKEDFTYDDLDRLKTVGLTVGGTAGNPLTVNYDQLGNIKSKVVNGTTVQSWTYGGSAGCAQAVGPHAVRVSAGATYCYDANGNQTTATYSGGNTRTITYTGYDMPSQISTTGYPSVATESFAYAPDRSMFKRVEGASAGNDKIFCNGFDTGTNTCPNTGGAATTYYVGNTETRINGTTTTSKRYVNGYLVITTTGTTTTYNYLFRDGLGSIDVITNEVAQVQQRQSFDAWGNRRDASAGGGWAILGSSVAASFDTSRTFQGYTGHQQLDPIGLVHMKGRLYDPALGRFIQADTMTESNGTQGLNRYSYVLNNPLSLTDPTGYLSFRQILGIAIAVVAAYFGQYELAHEALAWSFAISVAGGFLSAYVATGSFKAGLWGAFAAGVFWGIGTAFTDVAGGPMQDGSAMSLRYGTGSLAAKVAAHAAAGGVLNTLQGGNFGSGFIAAGVTEGLSPAIEHLPAPSRPVAAALVGGTVSKISGGKFANGAETGLFQELFNQGIHGTFSRPPTDEEVAAYNRTAALCADANAGLSMFRFGSEQGAADWFSSIANPITAQTGLEVGVNIMKDDYGYYLYNLHPSTYFGGGAVDIQPPGPDAPGKYVAFDHTHPTETGFSNNGAYWNQRTGLQGTDWGDLGVAINQGVNGYVSLPSGAQYRFDFGAFTRAQVPGNWTVYAADYVSKIK